MRILSIRHCPIILLALFLGSTVVGAQTDPTSPRGFKLEIDELQLVERLHLGVPTSTTAPPRKTAAQIAELQTFSVRDPRRLAQISNQQTAASSGNGKLRRTGRWMKKNWWAPTLIGVAVGVLLLEPFDDDDDERRRAQQMNP